MTVYILEILILALFCNGLKIAAEEGMVLSRPARWAENHLPLFIYKPLIGCVYCMSSIWGAFVHVLTGFLLSFSLVQLLVSLPIIVVCGCFGNGFTRLVYEILLEYWKKIRSDLTFELDNYDESVKNFPVQKD